MKKVKLLNKTVFYGSFETCVELLTGISTWQL